MQKCKNTKIQKDKKTKIQKYKMTKRQTDKKTKRQRPKKEYDIATSGQFRTLAMFFFISVIFVSAKYVFVFRKNFLPFEDINLISLSSLNTSAM